MPDYSDIINTPYPFKLKHERMRRGNRASQFSPFAALSGYEDAINEELRYVEKKPEITEEVKEEISTNLTYALSSESEIKITYFKEDKRKVGGSIEIATGIIKKIDESKNEIKINAESIKINSLLSAEIILPTKV